MNKRTCKNCNYWRLAGSMDFNIPGTGNWCLNSQSQNNRTRPLAQDSCIEFSQKGKKAPWWMRLANYLLGKFNKFMSKWKSKRP